MHIIDMHANIADAAVQTKFGVAACKWTLELNAETHKARNLWPPFHKTTSAVIMPDHKHTKLTKTLSEPENDNGSSEYPNSVLVFWSVFFPLYFPNQFFSFSIFVRQLFRNSLNFVSPHNVQQKTFFRSVLLVFFWSLGGPLSKHTQTKT